MPIYVTRPSIPNLEDFVEEIKPIFASHVLTNMGPVYRKFQSELIDYLGVPELSLFVNGHMALEMAIQALGWKEKSEKVGGGEVITTPFTFVSTTHAIVRSGLKPVFCDIRKSDYCIDVQKIEERITDKTVGIMPVHVYGNICNVQIIENISDKYGIKVIYDGAHAFGEKYMGRGIGCFGDATMFSFHATKVFNSIEGGAVSFWDKRYSAPLQELKNFGIHGEIEVSAVGGNAKLDEFRAAMGIANLRRMDQCIAARKAVHDLYCDRLGNRDGIVLRQIQSDVTSNYAYFPVYFDEEKFGKSRDDVYFALKERNIYSRKYFFPCTNELDCYRCYSDQITPVAHDVSTHILTLPIFEGLSMDDVNRICDIILG